MQTIKTPKQTSLHRKYNQVKAKHASNQPNQHVRNQTQNTPK